MSAFFCWNSASDCSTRCRAWSRSSTSTRFSLTTPAGLAQGCQHRDHPQVLEDHHRGDRPRLQGRDHRVQVLVVQQPAGRPTQDGQPRVVGHGRRVDDPGLALRWAFHELEVQDVHQAPIDQVQQPTERLRRHRASGELDHRWSTGPSPSGDSTALINTPPVVQFESQEARAFPVPGRLATLKRVGIRSSEQHLGDLARPCIRGREMAGCPHAAPECHGRLLDER